MTLRTFFAALIGVSMVIIPASSKGDQCSLIKEHDRRMLCFALTHCSLTYCETIRDGDSRTMCREQVKSQCKK